MLRVDERQSIAMLNVDAEGEAYGVADRIVSEIERELRSQTRFLLVMMFFTVLTTASLTYVAVRLA
jgi:hypothetical protein